MSVCAWCDSPSTGSVELAGRAVSVHYCDDHEATARQQAKNPRAFEKPNVANKVFGKRASDRATQEAARS